MFPYNEDEWLWMSARKTLQGELTIWQRKLKRPKIIKNCIHYCSDSFRNNYSWFYYK